MELEVVGQRELRLARRDVIVNLHNTIVNEGLDVGPESCPVTHHFAPHSYGREMFLPAGLVVVGKIHRHSHISVISKGRVQVFTEHDGVQELSAPCTFVSHPGTKRVVHVLEDTVWTTIHVTDKTDIEDIEREIVADDFSEVGT